MATGDFIGLLDHDDLLAPNALYEVAKALESHPKTDVIYTDEDKVRADLSEHFQPNLKPDLTLICFVLIIIFAISLWCAGQLWKQLVDSGKNNDGAQDYDFIFRCCESAKEIYHVPEILYHWRTHQASTADNPASKMYAFEAGNVQLKVI